MTDQLFLALAVEAQGAHHLRTAVGAAEQAGFTLVTFADSPRPQGPGPGRPFGWIEAGTQAAFVSTSTNRIGLAPELHLTVTEPFHLATQLASLDHASNGRGAWVVGAANEAADLATIGAASLSPESLHREITDVIDVVRDLWDSWQDDAVIRDVAAGRYLDPARVHHVNFQGAGFSVKGPLITPRPPQGQLVVIAPDHLDVTARADIVLVSGTDVEQIGLRADRARDSGATLVFAEVEVAIDEVAISKGTPATDRLRHTGSATALIDLLTALVPRVDGVRLQPAAPAADVPILIETVLPALASAGLLRAPAPGSTLRSTLGLPRPANRFAASATTTTTTLR